MSNIAYIDDKPYELLSGETILNFVRRNAKKDIIPTLCDAPNLEPFGSCRVCSVEVALQADGPTKTVASCHSPAMKDSYIYTSTEAIQRLRKNIIELVLTDHPLDCLTCEVNNNCELQTVAAKVGIRDVRYPEGANHLDRPKDHSHPYMTSELSKCINCYRCVRACEEVQGQFVLSMAGRGFDNHIIKGSDVSFFESDCVSCGACAQACPTSAISDVFESKSVVGVEKTRTVCTYCGVGCNLEVSTTNGKVKSIQAPYDAEVNQGHTCLKGRYAFSFYDHPDRLRTPLIRRNGVLEPASWDEAYDYIIDKLSNIKEKYGPDSIAGISSSRCTNEENYLMQKFIRAAIGTNNIDCCARVCHSPTALGMQKSFGTGAATNSIIDLKYTDCIMVIGANPTDGHPVTGAKLKQFAIKGKTSIVIDPRKTELAKYATYHLQLRPGTNVALLNMMLYYIILEGKEAKEFIEHRTEGYEEFRNGILSLDIDEMERVTGVDRKLAKEAALAYATAANAMSFHGLGVTEHSMGAKTVMLIANLAMMTGNIGRPGVGVNPLRGQNNVQGAADMGCQPHQGAGYMRVNDPAMQRLYQDFYGMPVSGEIGLKIPEMFEAARNGRLKALWLMGEDVVQTDPNSEAVKESMNALDFLVVQEIFMTETAKFANVILPAASFLEKSGTFTNAERRVQRVNAAVPPLEGTKPDGQIICEIMQHMGYPQADYTADGVLEEISRVVPFFKGATWEGLGDNGKQWPVKEGNVGTPIMHLDSFKRGLGKFHFFAWQESQEVLEHGLEFPYILTTGRLLEHYNCGTMTRRTGNADIVVEDVVVINPADAAKKGVTGGDWVRLFSARGEVRLRSRISEEVKPGVIYTTFHFPEHLVNNITSDVHDSDTLCPEYKVVAIDFERVGSGDEPAGLPIREKGRAHTLPV